MNNAAEAIAQRSVELEIFRAVRTSARSSRKLVEKEGEEDRVKPYFHQREWGKDAAKSQIGFIG